MADLSSLSPAKRALLEQALRRRREQARGAIGRRPPGSAVPLSPAQWRMWFLAQWEPESFTFNAARAVRLRGPLDRDALIRAATTVLERHESLRTVVVPGREPHQRLLEEWSLPLTVLKLEGELPRLLSELSREPFDLTRDVLFRVSVIEVRPDENVLLLRLHHIAGDAHSAGILFDELSELYAAYREGRPPSLPELPVQYADYTLWLAERLSGSFLDGLESYWRRQLEGIPELLSLPTDRRRPAVQRHAGAHRMLSFDRDLAERLLEISRPQQATFFMATLAAFGTLLYRRSGEPDIVIGSPIANRNRVELERVVGFFSNTLALRLRLSGNPTFRQVIARARETALGAYAHQELPFDKVVEAVAPRRDPSYNPLFQVNFRAQATERPRLQLAGLETELIHVDIGFSRFDLALELELGQHALEGYLEYDEDLFDVGTVDGLIEDLSSLLEQVVAEPDAPILAVKLPRRTRRHAGQIARRRQG